MACSDDVKCKMIKINWKHTHIKKESKEINFTRNINISKLPNVKVIGFMYKYNSIPYN